MGGENEPGYEENCCLTSYSWREQVEKEEEKY
jgi:hypothetical protein